MDNFVDSVCIKTEPNVYGETSLKQKIKTEVVSDEESKDWSNSSLKTQLQIKSEPEENEVYIKLETLTDETNENKNIDAEFSDADVKIEYQNHDDCDSLTMFGDPTSEIDGANNLEHSTFTTQYSNQEKSDSSNEGSDLLSDSQSSEDEDIVNKKKQHKCKVCNKTFPFKCKLTQHKITHTGIKPYECDVCKKTFSRKFHVVRHKLTHTDERPFECNLCDKKYRHKRDLNNHLFVHKGDKALLHCCNICKILFTVGIKPTKSNSESNVCPNCNTKLFTEKLKLSWRNRIKINK